jgi:hypothetical protein
LFQTLEQKFEDLQELEHTLQELYPKFRVGAEVSGVGAQVSELELIFQELEPKFQELKPTCQELEPKFWDGRHMFEERSLVSRVEVHVLRVGALNFERGSPHFRLPWLQELEPMCPVGEPKFHELGLDAKHYCMSVDYQV